MIEARHIGKIDDVIGGCANLQYTNSKWDTPLDSCCGG